jgi:adenylate cyclase
MSDQRLPKNLQFFFHAKTVNEMWYKMLTEGDPLHRNFRRLNGMVPTNPRCAACYTPFGGLGGAFSKFGIFWSRRSTKNPRFCTSCDAFNGKYPGGAEVDLTMLFVDVRGSTTIAEKMTTTEFSQLMNRFYQSSIQVLIEEDAFIDKLVGDEVTALFLPGYAGKMHARRAVRAGQTLLKVTGYGKPEDPWIPIGVGIHTGTAWVGSVVGASEEGSDFTALGDNVNIAARLASSAGPGEVLVSEAAWAAAQIDRGEIEHRDLELKGKSRPVSVIVLRTD